MKAFRELMGRIFETRKAKMFKRFARMSKAFNRVGREIEIAVKAGVTDPKMNPRLRLAIQNAKSVNMPKERIEAAINRASSKDTAGYQEITYEGYAPHGIALLIECATDNPTRTVANIRMAFSRGTGTLGTAGSIAFMFERKGAFKLPAYGNQISNFLIYFLADIADSFQVFGNAVKDIRLL